MGQSVTSDVLGKPTAAQPAATAAAMPNPGRLFQTFNAYQQTAAMRAAIDLDIFTAIGDRQTRTAQIAERVGAAERGIRILCDSVVAAGWFSTA